MVPNSETHVMVHYRSEFNQIQFRASVMVTVSLTVTLSLLAASKQVNNIN